MCALAYKRTLNESILFAESGRSLARVMYGNFFANPLFELACRKGQYSVVKLGTQRHVMMIAGSSVKVRSMVAPQFPVSSLRRSWKRQITAGLATGLAFISISGCAASEPIYLKSANGKIVHCGPYLDFGYLPAGSKSTEAKVWDCVSYYERNGYERVQSR
jgi:hypothetical protein